MHSITSNCNSTQSANINNNNISSSGSNNNNSSSNNKPISSSTSNNNVHLYSTINSPNCTVGSVCATVAFMDIKSASKAHTAEHKFDDRVLTTEYYEPSSIPSTSGENSPSSNSSLTTAVPLTSQTLQQNLQSSLSQLPSSAHGSTANTGSGTVLPPQQYSSSTVSPSSGHRLSTSNQGYVAFFALASSSFNCIE